MRNTNTKTPAMNRNRNRTACVMMTGPDVQMDQRGTSCEPANALPAKCPHCTFPDLDFVPNPYFLTKGVSSPAETSPAQLGNFLVRERVRRLLEVVIPDACNFHPTVERKSKKPAPWWLAVPTHKLATPIPKPNPPFCSRCHEPKMWNCRMGATWEQMASYDSGGVDIFKTLQWQSAENGCVEDVFERGHRSFIPPLSWREWIRMSCFNTSHGNLGPPFHTERWTRLTLRRDLYFSVRLEQLFKRAKVKGQLMRLGVYFTDLKPTPEDEAWVQEKLRLLTEHGLAEAQGHGRKPGGQAVQKWFRGFLTRRTKNQVQSVDFTTIENEHKLTLPNDYKDFISMVGPMSFEDVMEMEGFTANVLPPMKLDFTCYRRGCLPELDEEQSQIDGVMFAETEHGDAFVFDVSVNGGDYPVFWHDHEQNTLEPFAPNFAECIKRFAQKD